MNVENWNATIDLLEKIPDDRFDMYEWCSLGEHCNTIGCIAGWITMTLSHSAPTISAYYNDHETYMEVVMESAFDTAQSFLGINSNQANYLFMGRFTDKESRSEITRQEAIDYMKLVRDDPNHGFHELQEVRDFFS